MVLAQQEEALARFGFNPGTTPAAFAAAQAQALAALNAAIGEVTGAYGGSPPSADGGPRRGGRRRRRTGRPPGYAGGAAGPPRRAWPPDCRPGDGWCRAGGHGYLGPGRRARSTGRRHRYGG